MRTTFGDLVDFCYAPELPEPQAPIAAWLVRVLLLGRGGVA